ncbi:MAG: hypothetical protein K0S80_3673, partial [Neobacillus sp.]|nr:hypothetical protein [Neobacillus sp.]
VELSETINILYAPMNLNMRNVEVFLPIFFVLRKDWNIALFIFSR